MRKIFAAVFGLLFFIFNTCSAYAPQGKLFVTMLDIGQGDSILIETGEQNILIDTGDLQNCDRLVDKLHSLGIERFERVILTHPHADHIGGVQAVLDNFDVDEISDNGFRSSSPLYKKYRSADVKFSSLKAGDILDFGGGVQFKVLLPNPFAHFKKINDQSVVGKLIFADFAMLFTGDIEKDAEDFLNHANLRADILKAPHHGSKTSSAFDFVDRVKPEFVFISAGYKNKFGHPHKKALRNYRVNFVLPEKIFCTAFNGSIRVETDGLNKTVAVENDFDWFDHYLGEKISVTRIL